MTKDNYRYIARFVVETNTPMAVGSGEKGLTVDRLIARDANGLPYIPGTSLAGVVRHELGEYISEDLVNSIFGFQVTGNEGLGSRINFSSAILLADDGKTVLEGLHKVDFSKGYYSYFNRLPERDHVRITHRSTADTEGHGKFDEQLVHKGTRFVFEIELEGIKADEENWNQILNILHRPSFRIGAGTRKGFGKLNIIECKEKKLDLNKEISDYLSITSSLNKNVKNWSDFKPDSIIEDEKYYRYKISLKPENFYIFGSGIGDEDVDMTPKTEMFFDWSGDKPKLTEDKILIPGTSVKGALSHRVAYYYNKNSGVTIESNNPEYNEIDENILIDSLSDFKELERQVNQVVEETNKGLPVGNDVDQLMILKKELEQKQIEIRQLAENLRNINSEKIISDSYSWKRYEQDIEDQKKQFAELNPNVAELNEAVKLLFGYANNTKNSKGDRKINGLRGRVILSDVYLDEKHANVKEKVFDHVAIDRFTGGGIDGALYQEKAVSSNSFSLDLYVEKQTFETKGIKEVLECALDDLVNGNIQLGGNTGKGHGAFTGSYKLLNAE